MEKLHLTHSVVHGAPEHFANLAYLIGLDPCFEESVLVIAKQGNMIIGEFGRLPMLEWTDSIGLWQP